MPPRKKAQTGNVRDSQKKIFEIEHQKEAIEDALEELKMQVDARCKKIELNASAIAGKIRNEFSVTLTSIPKHIRGMNAREFINQYHGDVKVVVEQEMRKIEELTHENCNAARQARRNSKLQGKLGKHTSTGTLRVGTIKRSALKNSKVNASPSRPMQPNMICETPLSKTARRLRDGEVLQSMNGSPIVISDEMRQSLSTAQPRASVIGSNIIQVNLASKDKTIELHSPSATENLSPQDRKDAIEQLEALRKQLDSIMGTLKPTS